MKILLCSQLTVIILVDQFKYSFTDVVDVFCDIRVLVPLYLVDNLNRWKKAILMSVPVQTLYTMCTNKVVTICNKSVHL